MITNPGQAGPAGRPGAPALAALRAGPEQLTGVPQGILAWSR